MDADLKAAESWCQYLDDKDPTGHAAKNIRALLAELVTLRARVAVLEEECRALRAFDAAYVEHTGGYPLGTHQHIGNRPCSLCAPRDRWASARRATDENGGIA